MNLVGVADLGTYSTKALLGKIGGGEITLYGVGKSNSEGVREGRIAKPNQAGDSLREAVQRAQEMASRNMESFYLGVGGDLISFATKEATVSITSKDRIVKQKDIERLNDLVGSLDLNPGARVISKIPQEFKLDGQTGVHNPLGLQGRRLDMTATLAIMDQKSIGCFRETARHAGLELAGLLPTPVCLGSSLLTEEGRQRGKLFLDFGAGKFELTVFRQGKLIDHQCFSLGGKHLTGDLAAKFNISLEKARGIKHEVDLSGPLGKGPSAVNSSTKSTNSGEPDLEAVRTVLEARLKETIDLILTEIQQLGHEDLIHRGIKLTGGNVRLNGLIDFLNDQFEPTFQIGRPTQNIMGIEDLVGNTSYGPSLALLSSLTNRWIQEEEIQTGKIAANYSWFTKALKNLGLFSDSDD